MILAARREASGEADGLGAAIDPDDLAAMPRQKRAAGAGAAPRIEHPVEWAKLYQRALVEWDGGGGLGR